MGFIDITVLILFGVFVYHKVNGTGDIAKWSWWRVTSPLWIYFIIIIFPLIVFGFFGFLAIIIGIFAAIFH